jgi:hypothetical protein
MYSFESPWIDDPNDPLMQYVFVLTCSSCPTMSKANTPCGNKRLCEALSPKFKWMHPQGVEVDDDDEEQSWCRATELVDLI